MTGSTGKDQSGDLVPGARPKSLLAYQQGRPQAHALLHLDQSDQRFLMSA